MTGKIMEGSRISKWCSLVSNPGQKVLDFILYAMQLCKCWLCNHLEITWINSLCSKQTNPKKQNSQELKENPLFKKQNWDNWMSTQKRRNRDRDMVTVVKWSIACSQWLWAMLDLKGGTERTQSWLSTAAQCIRVISLHCVRLLEWH